MGGTGCVRPLPKVMAHEQKASWAGRWRPGERMRARCEGWSCGRRGVWSNNTVRVIARNISAATFDLAAATLSVGVTKRRVP